MSYEALMDDIRKLTPEQYDFVVKIVENLPKEESLELEESDIAAKTNLSKNRRNFLKTAGKINIDENAVEELRMRSMI